MGPRREDRGADASSRRTRRCRRRTSARRPRRRRLLEKSQASQWAGKGLAERTWVVVHPEAAGGLAEGDVVTVRSAKGALEAELRFDAEQRRDVAIMPKGGHFDRGHCANKLIEAQPTDLGLGAAYLDCRVVIEAR